MPTPASDFPAFLERFHHSLRTVFDGRVSVDELSSRRGLPPFVLREILSTDPLTTFIPKAYGGRGAHPSESISVLEVAGYESLALSLLLGISGALFLLPVARHGQDAVKEGVFRRFVRDRALGGLMITEPGYGSDAMNMETAYTAEEGGYHLKGTKHWGGLTGWADFWLLTARRRDQDGQLARDIDFFICDVNQPAQRIVVEEYFHNLGLYMIPYGRNRIDLKVPKEHRLNPQAVGPKLLLDTLHRSRLFFPAMGMGFLRRLLDEAIQHSQQRHVGRYNLFHYDQVKHRIARLQAAFTACSAMCLYASEHAGIENDLSQDGVLPNAIKSVTTDLMQESAQSLLQLVGAKGYRLDHVAGRAVVDSRPFQIFEGSNDILYNQLGEGLLRTMGFSKESNLFKYLRAYEPTARASEYLKDSLNLEISGKLPQRKAVALGQILGRLITMDLTVRLGERGFRKDLIDSCLQVFRDDVEQLLTSYRSTDLPAPIVDYGEGASWRACLDPAV